MVITFSNIKGSTGGGGATGGTVTGITLWSDETTKAYIDNALSGVTDVLSAYTKTEDFATINGSAITSGGNIVVEATPYTAGTNIDITDHIISVTGITIPTKVSELVNDSGYITTADTQNFVTSGDVQTQINDSISGKADSSAVTAQISEVKQEIEAEIPSKVSDLQNDLNFVNSGDVKTQIDNAVSGKQDTLVSGENIKTINNQSLLGSGNIEIQGGGETYSAGEGIGIDADNTISVTGNYETIVELTQAEYDALTSYGKNTTYVITDAPAVNLSAYTPTSGFSTINGNVITDGGNIEIQGGNTYTAGANIDISTDNVISVTGITMPTKLSELTNDEGFVNSGEVETQITNKDYPTKNWVQDNINLAIESETARTESTYAKIGDIPSLDGYATTEWVESQGYLKEHQDISGKLDSNVFTAYTANTQTELNNKQDISGMTEYATTAFTENTYAKIGDIPTKTSELTNDNGFITDAALSGYATEQYVDNSVSGKVDNSALTQYYTSAQTDTAISNAISGKLDASAITAYSTTEEVENMITAATNGLASEEWVESQGYLKEHQSLSAYTPTSGFSTINGSAITEGGNLVIEETPYTAGTNIDITDHIISVTGITVPTKVSELTNDEGFINSGQAQTQIDNATSGKQDTLVSGVNIKTINNESLLGSGNIVIEGGSSIKNYQPLQVEFSPNYSFIDAYEISSIGTQQFYKRIAFDTINGNSIIHQSDNDKVNWTIPTSTSALTNDSGYVTSGEVNTQITNKGYITGYTETDPVFMASAASGISAQDITNWNGKQPSGDYALRSELPTVPTSNTAFTNDAGYITDAALNGYATTAFTESTYLKEHQSLSAYTPTSGFSTINGNVITDGGNIVVEETPYSGGTNIDITDHIISVTGITIPTSNTAFTNDAGYVTSGEVETQITNKGYLTAYTESDPVFQASAASGITEQNITNWNNKLDSSALNPYYTSAQTNTAISNAVSGKTDKVSVTASSGGYKFPKWNNQGCITGTYGTAYLASQRINDSSRKFYSDSSEALPTIYAPTSEGLAGQPLLSNGSGAPVWGAYKFQFISQSQYDALAAKDSTTIYFIVNEN